MNAKLQSLLTLLVGIAAAALLLRQGITEEVPIARVSGTLVMSENGKPLPGAEVTFEPIVADDEAPARRRFVETDENGRFKISTMVAGPYTVYVDAKAHSVERQIVMVHEKDENVVNLDAKPNEPYLDIYANSHVFQPGETPAIEVRGFFKDPKFKLTVRKFGMDTVVKQGSLYNAFAYYRNALTAKDPAKMGEVFREEKFDAIKTDAEGILEHKLQPKDLPEGMYWVSIEGGGFTRGTWLMVTRIGLIGKESKDKRLAYVVDLKEGKPIPGATISVIVGNTAKPVGKTDSNGLLSFPREQNTGAIVASTGESQAFIGFYQEQEKDARTRMTLYTDRPIYRPGDSISFKGVVRQIDGNHLRLPQPAAVEVELMDRDGEAVSKANLHSSSFGTFSGTFTTNKEAEPGTFTVRASSTGIEASRDVAVAAYRKPTYNIEVKPTQDEYILGRTIQFKVSTNYYFGGPVEDAKVTATLYRQPLWSYENENGDMTEGEDYGEGGGEYIDEQEGVTNSSGQATFNFPSIPPDSKVEPNNYKYRLYVSVADAAGKYYDAEGTVNVVQGLLDLRVGTSKYATAPGESNTITVDVTDSSGKPAASRSVELSYGRQKWDGVETVTLEKQTTRASTDSSGKATFTVSPAKVGDYRFEATVLDDQGNRITGDTYVYVFGEGYEPSEELGALTAKFDKRSYSAGETATLILTTSNPGGTALVTIEGAALYDVRTIPLTGAMTTVPVTVEDSYTPNVTVSIVYVRNKQFSQTERPLRVSLGNRDLKVRVTSNRDNFEPGQTATYDIETSLANGTPAPAEVSLGVVDESIYALASDTYDIAFELYPQQYNSIETQYSFPDLYLDGGDKAPTNIQVRRTFKDTAFWAPVVVTDASGHATVQVPLPDNLTEWRATVRAVTASGEAGQSTSQIVVNKPLMVRIEAPSFLQVDDDQTFKAVITNNSGMQAEVGLQMDAAGCDVTGDQTRKVTVADGATQAIEFTAIPRQVGSATFTAKAWIDGGPNDGVESKIPIKAFGLYEHERLSGKLANRGNITLKLKDGVVPGSARIKLSASPSLALELVGPLDYLIDYPYGCVEQTMSRFMPAIVVQAALKKLNLPPPAKAAEIPKIASDSLARLAKMQSTSGGWGWWEYDNADDGMTGYVLEGLAKSKALGFGTGTIRMDEALDYATKLLRTEVTKPRVERYPGSEIWILSKYGRKLEDRARLEYAVALWRPDAVKAMMKPIPAEAGITAYASRALTLKVLGMDPSGAIQKLSSAAIKEGDLAHWEGDWWYGDTTTASCLKAMALVDPKNPLVLNGLRYLQARKKADYWASTRDTSEILQVVAAYVEAFPESTTPCNVLVQVNGKDVTRLSLGQGGITQNSFVIPQEALQTGDNVVTLVRSNPGSIYYDADMEQTVASKEIPSKQGPDGLSIRRTYHKLGTFKYEDGSSRTITEPQAITSVRAGDIVEVRLHIENPSPMEFVKIEDPIPSGARIVERDDLDPEDWTFWWSKLLVYDDRAVFFCYFLNQGKHDIVYRFRAEMPGHNRALPAYIENMYAPNVGASSGHSTLEINK